MQKRFRRDVQMLYQCCPINAPLDFMIAHAAPPRVLPQNLVALPPLCHFQTLFNQVNFALGGADTLRKLFIENHQLA